jgi:hypothetical protein
MTAIPTMMREPVAAQWSGPMAGSTIARREVDDAATSDDQAAFLREMVRRLDGDASRVEKPEELANLAARRLVSATFVEQIVRDARENSAASGRFAPGIAEQRFGHLMDRSLADAIVAQPGFAGVSSLERRLLDQIRQQLGTAEITRVEEPRS